jgi:hypothetical protein
MAFMALPISLPQGLPLDRVCCFFLRIGGCQPKLQGLPLNKARPNAESKNGCTIFEKCKKTAPKHGHHIASYDII